MATKASGAKKVNVRVNKPISSKAAPKRAVKTAVKKTVEKPVAKKTAATTARKPRTVKKKGLIKDEFKKIKELADEKINEPLVEGFEKESAEQAVPVARLAREIERVVRREEENIKQGQKDVVIKEEEAEVEEAESDTDENLLPEEVFEEKPAEQKISISLYRKIAYSFIILTLALLGVIFYFSFAKVNISLVPREDLVSNNLILDIYEKADALEIEPGKLLGAIDSFELESSQTYQASGSDVVGEEATGKATIVNNYNKNQPLVASTRLLSGDNKLFRIKNTVNVPAGGTAEVEIYADKPGPDMAISEPTTFIIPGLWAGLQEKIYAKSNGPITYQNKTKKFIQQSDVDGGVVALKQKLLDEAKKGIGEIYKDYSNVNYKIDDDSVAFEVDGNVGEEKENFSISMQAKVIVVAFSGSEAEKMAQSKLESAIPAGKELVVFGQKNVEYILQNYDVKEGTATLNATFEGKVALKNDSAILDREKLVGLTREQLEDYLDKLPEIENYEIKFSPSFIKKVPNLTDKIKIDIKRK